MSTGQSWWWNVEWLDALVSHAASRLDERVQEALFARGVSEEQMTVYQLGYLDRELPSLDYPQEFLEWSHHGKKLDDVLVLPLTNTLGVVRGLQFRHVERDRTGYMDWFATKEEPVLFGLGQAMPHVWATRSIYLVEGAFDHFPLQRHIPTIVATLTAHVGANFLRSLRRLVDEIWLGYDMDQAGRHACLAFTKAHGKEFTRVHTVTYPKVQIVGGHVVKDPGELWEAWGDSQVAQFVRTLHTEPF